MAVTGRKLRNSTEELEIDANPTVSPGVTAPIGSTAILTTTGALYTKTGAGDLQWTLYGGASGSNLGVVQKRRTTTYTMTGSFANITFDTTDVQTNTEVVDADPVNTERIRIQETGLYELCYTLNTEVSASGTISYRALINNTTTIPGSTQTIDGGDELSVVKFYAVLTAGNFVTVQLQNVGGSGVLVANSTFSVARCAGAQGPQGIAGGSTITVEEEGSAVASNISIINFVGPTTTVTTPNAGEVTVTTSPFGANAVYAESLAVSTNATTTYQTKVTLSTGAVPAGTYRISWQYNWYYTNATRNFDSRVRLNNTTDVGIHLEEPSDTSTAQRRVEQGFNFVNLTAATHSFTLEWRSSNASDTAGIVNARMEFWRIV